MTSYFLNPQLILSQGIASSAVSALFSAVWEGTALVVCVALLLRLFPRLSAAARSLVWLNVFLLLVVLHLIPQQLPDQGSRWAAISGQAHGAFNFNPIWSLAIAGVWVLLSLLRAGQLMLSAVRVRGLARRAVAVEVDEDLKPLLQIKNGKSLRNRAELCVSSDVERPSVLGFFHPRILLPPALMEELSASELRQVVVHEMEHLRRGDDWTNLLQKLALVFFPLNPALLWVERRLCAERELACDDSVLRTSGARKAYAICLTHLAEYAMLRRGLSLVLGAWEKQSELVRRVHRILRKPGASLSRRQTMALTTSLIVGVVACGFGLSRSPRLVSFSAPASTEDAAIVPAGNFRAVSTEPLALQTGVRAPHEQLLKAEMPASVHESNALVGNGLATSSTGAATLKHVVKRQSRRRPAPSQQAWLVMTEWTSDETSQRMVLTVAQMDRDTNTGAQTVRKKTGVQAMNPQAMNPQTGGEPPLRRVTYAAVPLADGWLIIQI